MVVRLSYILYNVSLLALPAPARQHTELLHCHWLHFLCGTVHPVAVL